MKNGIAIPQGLRDAVRGRRILPFVGSGVSLGVKPGLFPTWPGLLLKMAETLKREERPHHATLVETFVAMGDLFQAAEKAYDGLQRNGFNQVMLKQFFHKRRPADSSLAVPERLWRLSPRLVLTTNYDSVLEWANPEARHLCNHQKSELALLNDLESESHPPYVWHLHGYIEQLDSLILAPSQYARFYAAEESPLADYQWALARMKHFVATHSLLFVGFGLQDAYVMDLLQGVLEVAGDLESSYAILGKDAGDKREYWTKYRVQVIEVPDFGESLLGLLDELGQSPDGGGPWLASTGDGTLPSGPTAGSSGDGSAGVGDGAPAAVSGGTGRSRKPRRKSPAASDQTPKATPKFRCEKLSKRWDVSLPSGDLVTQEIFVGMRCVKGKLSEALMFTLSEALTECTFTAHSADPEYKVTTERRVSQSDADGRRREEWSLVFDPPLGARPITVVCERIYRGLMFSSAQAQMRFGLKKMKIGEESCTQNVRAQFDKMTLSVRFLIDPWMIMGEEGSPQLPEHVALRVVSENDEECPEAHSAQHVSLTYWGTRLFEHEECTENSIPEAILHVQRPKIGHKYVLWWKLPPRDLTSGDEALLRTWKTLYQMRRGPGDALQYYVDRILLDTRATLKQMHGPERHEPDLHCLLYAFDEPRSELVCIRDTSDRQHPLSNTRFRWGREVVGTAFRRCEPSFFVRREFAAGSAAFEGFPQEVEIAFCIPLTGAPRPAEDWPVAVVVLASNNAESGLFSFLYDEQASQRHADLAEDRWRGGVLPF
jgi:hypothetical protein